MRLYRLVLLTVAALVMLPTCDFQRLRTTTERYRINAPCYVLFGYWWKRISKVVQECYNERMPKPSFRGDTRPWTFVENPNCTARCVVKKLGVFYENGTFDLNEGLWFMDKYIPERVRDIVVDIAEKCVDLIADLQSEDEKCSKFGRIVKCASKRLPVLNKLCYPNSTGTDLFPREPSVVLPPQSRGRRR